MVEEMEREFEGISTYHYLSNLAHFLHMKNLEHVQYFTCRCYSRSSTDKI